MLNSSICGNVSYSLFASGYEPNYIHVYQLEHLHDHIVLLVAYYCTESTVVTK